jgi:hypothetical protein
MKGTTTSPEVIDRRDAVARISSVLAAGVTWPLLSAQPQIEGDDGHLLDAEGRVPLWRGGGYGGMLMRANLEQLREEILATGRITQAQFERDLARLDDEDFVRPSSVMWAVWGRRLPLSTEDVARGQRGAQQLLGG